MLIEMVYADPHDQRHIELEVAEGSNVAACLALLRLHPMGKDLAIEDIARQADSLPYVLMCGLGPRVTRTYPSPSTVSLEL